LGSADTLTAAEAIALARLAGATEDNASSESKVKPAILFCFEEDERNFRMANELNDYWQDLDGINVELGPGSIPEEKRTRYRRQRQFQIRIFAFLPRSGPLRDILEESSDSFAIRPFGDVREGIERAHDGLTDDVAIDIAWSYDAEKIREKARNDWCAAHHRQREDTAISDIPIPADDQLGVVHRSAYRSIWHGKPFWEQISNRNAAEHARIMMQIIGFSIANDEGSPGSSKIDFEAFDERDKRLLAAIEHNRWMAERLLMGWSYGPRMDQPPQRESLCPNAELPEDEWIKDYNQVKSVLKFLENRGVLFHRASAGLK
jgi:hypothetical protein